MAVKPAVPALDTGHELYSGLLACYPFNDASGETISDLLGSLDATISTGGGNWGSDAEVGDYWQATSGNLATVAANATFNAIDTAFSVSFLLKAPGTYSNLDRVLTCFRTGGGAETNKGVSLLVSNDSPNGEMWAASRSDDLGAASISVYEGEVDSLDGSWHRIVYTWDGTDIKVYVDGVETATGSMSGSWINHAGDLIFAGDGAGSPQLEDALYGDCRVWDRALSAGEVSREASDPWALYGDPISSYTPDLDDSGFTDLGTASRTVYVSKSGSDANDGLSTGAPKLTLAAAEGVLRDGFADHMLLNRGDTWTNERFTGWDKSGASSSAKMVIGAYGTGDRPIVTATSGSWWYSNVGVEHLAITSLDIRGSGGEESGISVLVGIDDLLIEDCKFSGFNDGIILQGTYTGANGSARHTNCTVRRNVICDNYTGSTGHSQGIFADNCDNLIVEENYLDRNGWESDRDTQATIYNHNVYLQYDNGEITFRKNWSSRASSHGLQARSGGDVHDNVFYANPINMLVGYSGLDDQFTARVRRNVVIDSADITSSLARGMALDLSMTSDGDVSYNIWAHRVNGGDGRKPNFFYDGGLASTENVDVFKNIIYKWPGRYLSFASEVRGFTFTDNDIQDSTAEEVVSSYPSNLDAVSGIRYYTTATDGNRFLYSGSLVTDASWKSSVGDSGSTLTDLSGTYTDPEKDMDDYAVSIGLADADALLTQIRTQRKGNWDLNLTPDRINAYFRANFDMRPAPSSFTATKDGVDVDLESTSYAPESDSFVFQRSPNGVDTWTQIATPTSPSATDTNPGTGTWYYRVAAVVDAVTGDWSDVVSVTFSDGGAGNPAGGGTWNGWW